MSLFPENLRQDHEDGDVVFFCGAGVSMPAGFPSFEGLVPETITVVENWLQPEKWGDTLHDLKESNLHKRFPEAAWTLIRHVIGEETQTVGLGLSEILDVLVQEYPEAANHIYFQRLQARGE